MTKLDDLTIPIESIAKEHKFIIHELSKYLYNGELALALGAGVSKSFGFPLWWELVDELCIHHYKESTINASTSPKELASIVDDIEREIRNNTEFNKLVSSVLYKNINYITDSSIIKNDLLISLGSLMMGSRRGSIKNIITYNFDDLLEWYLGIHGFDVRVIQDPRRTTTNSDVIIYHPNGFLPLKSREKNGRSLLFSETSFINRQKEATPLDKLWENILEGLFVQKVFIFVGLSGNDPSIFPRFLNLYENIIEKKRPIGFWFYGETEEMNDRKIKENLRCGIIPIVLKNNNLIPDFLLKLRRYL
jgi:hypothetical protein